MRLSYFFKFFNVATRKFEIPYVAYTIFLLGSVTIELSKFIVEYWCVSPDTVYKYMDDDSLVYLIYETFVSYKK